MQAEWLIRKGGGAHVLVVMALGLCHPPPSMPTLVSAPAAELIALGAG